MKMKPSLLPLILVPLWLVSAIPVWAVEQVTLFEALSATLQEQPTVLSAAAEVDAAAAEVQKQNSRYLPRLTLSERLVRTDEPGGSLFISLNQKRLKLTQDADDYNDPPARSDFETRLTLNQTLFDPDRKFDRGRAELKLAAAGALEERRREEATLATLQAYLAVQEGHARLGWVEQSLEESEELVAMASEREKSGIGLRADTLRSEVLRNDAHRQHLIARHALLSAQRRLALAIGRAAGEVDIAEPAQIDALALPDAGASLQRADLTALARSVESAELATRQERAAYLPRAGLQASYVRHEQDLSFADNADAWSASAGLEWLLFDGGERSSAVAAARARQRVLELQENEANRQAHFAVAEALQQSAEAEAQLELARSSLVAAEAGRDLTSPRYDAGLASLSDLLAVQTELARVRSELAAAEANLLSTRANVYYAQGTLLQALLPESEIRP